jgi:hypothetical protein
MMMRREVLARSGGYPEHGPGAVYEDWCLGLKLLFMGARGRHVPAPLFVYRVHDAGHLAELRRHHVRNWARAVRGAC